MIDSRSFPSMLQHRASLHPRRPAVVFIDDAGGEQAIDYSQLWRRARRVAAALRQAGEALAPREAAEPAGRQGPAPRALLLFPAGIDFLPAFVGAQLAGWLPVPTVYPRPHRAMPQLDALARDCQPAAILSDARTLASLDRSKLDPAVAQIPWVAVDAEEGIDAEESDQGAGAADPWAAPLPDSLALLQYTSGSTSAPKGVMISQRNLMTNLEAIRTSFALPWQDDQAAEVTTAVFWLPHYHDMGLIGGLLAPLYLGYRTVLMSPRSFVRRPIQWLQTIDRYSAAVTGAPSFAFELCVDRVSPQQADGLDLASLQVTFCGAEPIRAAALQGFARRFAAAGFRSQSFYPCYGLAESTLLAAGGRGPAVPTVLELDRAALRSGRVRVLASDSPEKKTTLVGCGSAPADSELVIVDPQTGAPLPEGQIGEIWLRGASVSSGYWNREQENAQRFNASVAPPRPRWAERLWRGRSGLASATENPSDQSGYFRTGDLGLIHLSQLYITGRIKDVIIIRGRNYAPQDLEATIAAAPEAPFGRVAAVSVEGPRGESLAVIAEIARQTPSNQYAGLVRQIRRQVIEEHEVDPRQVLLVRSATLPVTTSGKLQRSRCQQWLRGESGEGDLRGALHHWQRSGGAESPPLPLPSLPARPGQDDLPALRSTIRQWIVQWLTVRGGVEPDQIDVHRSFEDYGLDSLMAIELIGDLEDGCDVELTPSIAWEHPTIDKMANLVAARLCGIADSDAQPPAADPASQQATAP